MTVFWILTALLALAITAVLGAALLRGGAAAASPETFDLKVYRDQLREVRRDRERGVIAADEADRLETEVSRRILAADAAGTVTDRSGQPGRLGVVMAGIIGLFVLGGAYALYADLGAPGYGDLGRTARIAAAEAARLDRPGQAEAEAAAAERLPATPEPSEEYSALVGRLRAAVAERPDDLEGLRLLARSEGALGNYAAAYAAQQRILELKGDDARSGDYADLGDMMILAAGGYVSPEAERALQAALERDPGNGVARYYAGLSYAQTGRPDRAFRIWDDLLRASGPDDPWIAPVLEQITPIARQAGITDYAPPVPEGTGPLPGPSGEDMTAAAEMSPEARSEMIRGMVAQLSDRLANEGGSPEEWSRLIGAYAVLGEGQRAMDIYAEAQQVFAENAPALRTIREAAQGAGIGQ